MRSALVRFHFAVSAAEAIEADAVVAVDVVDASSTVMARHRSALVDVDVTVVPAETSLAGAHVRIEVMQARTLVLARARDALVDVVFALVASISRCALARKLIDAAFHATRTVEARLRQALVEIRATVDTRVAGDAEAGVVVGRNQAVLS